MKNPLFLEFDLNKKCLSDIYLEKANVIKRAEDLVDNHPLFYEGITVTDKGVYVDCK